MSIYDYLIDFPPAIATTVAADEDAFLDKVGGNTLDCGSRFLYGFSYLSLGAFGVILYNSEYCQFFQSTIQSINLRL